MTRVIHYICNIKIKDFLLCQYVIKTCSWELVSVTSSVFSFKSETVVIAVYVDVVFNTLLVAFVFWFKVSDAFWFLHLFVH
jgi:hypothetical protein